MTVSAGAQANKRLELAIALAPAPRVNAAEGHSACPLFSGHRALAAQARCSTDATLMQRVSGYVAAVSGAMLMVLFPVLAQAWQCVEQKPLLTSDVSVQIFFTETPVAGVELELSTEGAGSKVVAAAKTDESGYVHFVGVSPGRYRLQWTSAPYPSLSRRLRVVGPGQGPKRLLVVGLTMMCPNVCSVGDPGGALKKAPKC